MEMTFIRVDVEFEGHKTSKVVSCPTHIWDSLTCAEKESFLEESALKIDWEWELAV